MRWCQMFAVSARFVTVILLGLNIQNARWEVTYIKLFYYHWIIHGNKYLAARTCFLASFNGVMTAAMQRGTFPVANIYCHAKMTWADMLIIQYAFMYLILVCFCYLREVSCFDKDAQKYLFVWSYVFLAIGDMIVKIHALQTLALDGGEWLTLQSSSFTLQRLRLCMRRVRSLVRPRALLDIVTKVEFLLLPWDHFWFIPAYFDRYPVTDRFRYGGVFFWWGTYGREVFICPSVATVVWEFLKIKVFLEKLSLFTSLVRCVLFGPNSEQILFAVRTFFIVSVRAKHHHHQFLLSLRVHRASMYKTHEPCMCWYNSVRRCWALASCMLCVFMNVLLLLRFLQK